MDTGGGIFGATGTYSLNLRNIRFEYSYTFPDVPGCLSTSVGPIRGTNVSIASLDQEPICTVRVYAGVTKIHSLGFTWCNGTDTGFIGTGIISDTSFVTTSNDPVVQVIGYTSDAAIDQLQFKMASGKLSAVYGGPTANATSFTIDLGLGLLGAEGTVYAGTLGSLRFRYKCPPPTTAPTEVSTIASYIG